MLQRAVSGLINDFTRVVGATIVITALTCAPAEAELITFYSGDGGDVVNGGAAVVLTPHPAWGDVSTYAGLDPGTAQWISFDDTGYEGTIAPNAESRELGEQTAVFTRTFNILSDGILSLWVLADDTATVQLLGPGGYVNTLFTAYPNQVDPCAPGGTGEGLGCVQADMGYGTVTNLAAGLYTLQINAFQTNEDVFGAQYAGTVESVPEPASLLLIGTGLSFLAVRKRQPARRKA